jgi:drug/metabolite transporter (DMT)-like permease
MFVGESGCWIVVFLSYLVRRIRGKNDNAYRPLRTEDGEERDGQDEDDEDAVAHLSASQTLVDPTNMVVKPIVEGERQPLTGWKITMLAMPAICDICGTTLMNIGLLFVAASIYQMTRGALVLFVGLFSVLFLKRHLSGWKWTSLFIVVLGVAVVGLAGVLENKDTHKVPKLPGDTQPKDLLNDAVLFIQKKKSNLESHTAAETVLGFFLIAVAQIFTATQFVLEESIMERYSMDPIQVVGWEGTFGFLVTLIGMGVLHAAVGQTPAGQGGYFDAREGFYEIFHYPAIGITSLLIMVSIG